MQQHVRVNDRPVEEYLIPDPQGSGSWRWDKGRWGEGGKVVDVIAALQSVSSLPRTAVLKCCSGI